MSDGSSSALPYSEPEILTILIYSSFLLALNVINFILDKIISCGLIGQVFIGVAWGTPGGKLFDKTAEDVIVNLGYLGLILLVYEGGLSTSFTALKANLSLSAGVALTGIALPIGLSYTLIGLVEATPLQAFAAGAALCSTSLGTTFTVMATSGLSATRLGVVLTSAAMMDDVVGLVMVQVISNMGDNSSFQTPTIIRPIFVSLGFGLAIPITARYIVQPLTLRLNKRRQANPDSFTHKVLLKRQTAFCLHTIILIALVVSATYAGTSNLFAAYLAGASISWWDSEVSHVDITKPEETAVMQGSKEIRAVETDASQSNPKMLQADHEHSTISDTAEEICDTTGEAVYTFYYKQIVEKLLQPFFFASIGFSIPIKLMFTRHVIWRGIVYATLMALAKFICGLWLIRFPSRAPLNRSTLSFEIKFRNYLASVLPASWQPKKIATEQPKTPGSRLRRLKSVNTLSVSTSTPIAPEDPAYSRGSSSLQTQMSTTTPNPARPLSLHPPLLLGTAMIARGEIGFLISSIAESRGIFDKGQSEGKQSSPSEVYLVVIWAVLLCTILGPLGVGVVVRRLRRLQKNGVPREDVLGVWGVGW